MSMERTYDYPIGTITVEASYAPYERDTGYGGFWEESTVIVEIEHAENALVLGYVVRDCPCADWPIDYVGLLRDGKPYKTIVEVGDGPVAEGIPGLVLGDFPKCAEAVDRFWTEIVEDERRVEAALGHAELEEQRERLWDQLQAKGGRDVELAERIDEIDRELADG